jgi:hypothetical protein
MIDQRLANLRFHLSTMDLSQDQVDNFILSAKEEINEIIQSLVEEAVTKVVDQAENKDASEFLKQIKLDTGTGDIQITTDSGMLDFSRPELPMLPWLLKNAKTSADGSQYKVIPIGKKDQNQQKMIKDVKRGLKAVRENTSMEDIASNIASSFNSGASLISSGVEPSLKTGEQEFRTASSKQNPGTSWVRPPKDMDLTSIVLEVNAHLRSEIQIVVDRVVYKYTREAEDVVRNG